MADLRKTITPDDYQKFPDLAAAVDRIVARLDVPLADVRLVTLLDDGTAEVEVLDRNEAGDFRLNPDRMLACRRVRG